VENSLKAVENPVEKINQKNLKKGVDIIKIR
jgi:hypothetical protein